LVGRIEGGGAIHDVGSERRGADVEGRGGFAHVGDFRQIVGGHPLVGQGNNGGADLKIVLHDVGEFLQVLEGVVGDAQGGWWGGDACHWSGKPAGGVRVGCAGRR